MFEKGFNFFIFNCFNNSKCSNFFIRSSKKELVYFELNTKSNISFLFLIEDLNKNLVSMQEIFINMKTGNIGFFVHSNSYWI